MSDFGIHKLNDNRIFEKQLDFEKCEFWTVNFLFLKGLSGSHFCYDRRFSSSLLNMLIKKLPTMRNCLIRAISLCYNVNARGLLI